MRKVSGIGLVGTIVVALAAQGCNEPDLAGCIEEIANGPMPVATVRTDRFQGKVSESSARCRGGDLAAKYLGLPWLDWTNYYAAGDAGSRSLPTQDFRGVGGALIDLEYQRIELIRFNLFDNNGTFEGYVRGVPGRHGSTLDVWQQFRLPPEHPQYAAAGGASPQQRCTGALIRGRTLSGICNDTRNPLMGSTGALFANNAEFETVFPDAGLNELSRNRHGGRLSLLVPDPQVISRKLFSRDGDTTSCADGAGLPGFPKDANCDYKKAPFFNVLAAFWIQFMTHDWFSHMEEGHNDAAYMPTGCVSQKVQGVETPLTADDAKRLGCRPADAIDRGYVASSDPPPTFDDGTGPRLGRAPKTFKNLNTAWWDASQIYGYDERSRIRVKRDPADPARLLMPPIEGRTAAGDRQGYLPLLAAEDPKLPDWAGQEATAFPDNWTVGISFFHNVFAREHNLFVDEFRRVAARRPNDDSGLRNPDRPTTVIRYRDVTPDELFEAARLVVAAEIAKIHTIEWTPQLLYNEPLFKGMNGNWSGLLGDRQGVLPDALERTLERLRQSPKERDANELYSILAAGPGIVGLGSHKKDWKLPDDADGGTNHFGSPFNFPQEFVSVYRLHPLLPDLIEYRDLAQPNAIAGKIPIVATFRGKATPFMRERGLSNWALSMGRQRLGALALRNHPRFLQNLRIERLDSPTKQIDLAALDIIRDREHGVPRFNEFRRQYGLRQLTSFDDFIDPHTPPAAAAGIEQRRLAGLLREVYGQHQCDASKTITRAQLNLDKTPINDCLGHPNGSMVDNIEDVDTVVGYLAETTRPHGFAISETQFVVFILNASRRLFSDRFLTSSFRPEFYTKLGLDWVNNNGPSKATEPFSINGHDKQPVSPLKRVLLRVAPELAAELAPVANAFDPWARDRGEYYSLEWKPRKGAETDEAFKTIPPIRFAPPGTDVARLRSDFALTDAERLALTPENIRELTQDQIDQIYNRLSAGPIPDGPFRGDLFFPRDGNRDARLSDTMSPVPNLLADVAARPIEGLGRALWKGKVFFKAQGILRNRIEDLAILKPVIKDTSTIPRLTFDGQTTWLLFPAIVSCGESRLDSTRRSIVIDYARGSEVEGYRPVPDKLAGPEGLNIRDEVRTVRRGFLLGRAYFGSRFGLNFTLIDPAVAEPSLTPDANADCAGPK